MSRIRYAAKWLIAQVLYRTGVFHAWMRVALRDRAVVLAYHRVLDQEGQRLTWSHPGIVVSPESFERHLLVLRRLFRVMTLDQFEAAILGRGFERPSCLITFDDGWWDTHAVAWPALEAAGLPAVVFVPSTYIGDTRTFWQERLGHVLFAVLDQSDEDPEMAERARAVLQGTLLEEFLEAAGSPDRAAIIRRLREAKLDAGFDPMPILQALESILPTPLPVPAVDRFVTWEQLREMARGGVTVGGHGTTHRMLTRLPLDEVIREATEPRRTLEQALGQPATAMSYPNGDWNPQVAAVIHAEGYRVAFSMEAGAVRAGDDPFTINRVNIHDGVAANVPMFIARLLGIF